MLILKVVVPLKETGALLDKKIGSVWPQVTNVHCTILVPYLFQFISYLFMILFKFSIKFVLIVTSSIFQEMYPLHLLFKFTHI